MHVRGLGYAPGYCKQPFNNNAIVCSDKAGRYAWKFEVPELPLYSQMHTIRTAKEVKRELTPKMIQFHLLCKHLPQASLASMQPSFPFG